MKRILIIDDHPMFRKGLINVLQGLKEHEIVCDETSCGEDALVQVAEQHYDLAIVDISMPGMGGLALLETLHRTIPNLSVLMLSMYSEDQFALRALRLGAAGYLTKQEADEELLTAVRHIFLGKRYLSKSLSEKLIDQTTHKYSDNNPTHSCLSAREFSIMQHLSTGKSLKCIAAELNISIKTVSTYKTRLFFKMGFKTSTDLITYAVQQQLI